MSIEQRIKLERTMLTFMEKGRSMTSTVEYEGHVVFLDGSRLEVTKNKGTQYVETRYYKIIRELSTDIVRTGQVDVIIHNYVAEEIE